jgi:type I site-specific restriction-modification system R (restriction) subunit
LSLLSKEIEKLKYELSDIIDQKFEHINRNLDRETKNLRTSYDELTSSLTTTSKDIMENYKKKMLELKGMIATFFAKTD